MGDPQRLLNSSSDADDLERELLGSMQRIEPPADAKGEAWARLSAQIAAVALVSTAHGSAAAASSSGTLASGTAGAGAAAGLAPTAFKLLGTKVVLGLAVAGATLGAAAVWVHRHPSQQQSALAPAAAAARVPPAAVPLAAAESVAPPVADTTPQLAPESPRQSPDQTRKDRLGAESALLTQARAELRGGNAAAAQQTLNRLRTKFPKGVLGQEREVLSIEVLAARGNSDAARRRAQAFIAAYPKSPHSAQLSRFAETP